MPWCLVAGCSSGYKSNPEKVHFFVVPKDEQIRSQWQIALKRSKPLKPKMQFVCDKHFLNEDILRTRYLFSPEGVVIGVSPYQRARLRMGAVPCLFPWTESKTPTITCEESTENLQESNNLETEIETDPLQIPNEQEIETVLDQTILLDKIEIIREENLVFYNLLTSDIPLPLSWIRRNVTQDDQPLVSFSQITCEKLNGTYRTFNLKEIIVDTNLQLYTHVLEKPLKDSTYITVKTSITSVSELENYLQQIDELNACKGCLLTEINENEKSDLISVDKQNILRHKDCSLLCFSLSCKFCKNAKTSVLRRRKINEIHEKTLKEIMKRRTKKNYLTLNLSNSGHVYVDKLRQKFIQSDTQKKKLRLINQQLRKTLRKYQNQMAIMSKDHILSQLQLNDVAKNQYYVVQEIIKASYRKNAKGHRYSEDWLMLCKLLYIRSPSGYNFIRDNDILPLPCERTMKRNLTISDTQCGFDVETILTPSDSS